MSRLFVVIPLVVSALGCAEEALRELRPHISLCGAADAPADACDDVIDVGDVPAAGAPVSVDVFVVNRGDGTLRLLGTRIDERDDVEIAVRPEVVQPGAAEKLTLSFLLGVDELGPGSAVLSVESNDAERSPANVQIVFNGVPPPQPHALVCDAEPADGDAECAQELIVDFGVVRPTQSSELAVFVLNDGDAPLGIDEILLEGSADFAVRSSTQGGVLDAGAAAAVVVEYAPSGVGDDEAALVFVVPGDPDVDEVRAVLRGSTGANAPPSAVAFESVTLATSASARVDDVVGVVGADSTDPEGDPLVYQWTLAAPAGSASVIEDPAAQNALFVPDVRGSYVVSLVVVDGVGQASAPAAVTVDAAPRFAFRARLTWTTGGDLDLHFVESGSAPFSARDCSFENRNVAAGDAALTTDDVALLDDTESAPGVEEVVIEAPAAGTWEVWVHVFDDGGNGAGDAAVDIIVDDGAVPVASAAQSLAQSCDLWHALDVTLPGATATPSAAPVVSQCR